MTFAVAVAAELTAAAAVAWWDSEEKVAMTKDMGWHGDWMRGGEVMVRWCGGGRWRRLLLIEWLFLLPQAAERWCVSRGGDT